MRLGVLDKRRSHNLPLVSRKAKMGEEFCFGTAVGVGEGEQIAGDFGLGQLSLGNVREFHGSSYHSALVKKGTKLREIITAPLLEKANLLVEPVALTLIFFRGLDLTPFHTVESIPIGGQLHKCVAQFRQLAFVST